MIHWRPPDRFFQHVLTLALAAAVLGACGPEDTVEQKIIREIRSMESALEAGERRNFLNHVSDDFRGQSGSMTRDELRAYVVFQLGRNKNLEARLFPITVSERGEREATAVFRALVTGGPNWIPERGQLYKIDTWWRLEGDEWKLISADWEPIPMGELID